MDVKKMTGEHGLEVRITGTDLKTSGRNGVTVNIGTDMIGNGGINDVICVHLTLLDDGTLKVSVVENTTGQPFGMLEVRSKTLYPKYVKMLAQGHKERGDWHVANDLLETLKS